MLLHRRFQGSNLGTFRDTGTQTTQSTIYPQTDLSYSHTSREFATYCRQCKIRIPYLDRKWGLHYCPVQKRRTARSKDLRLLLLCECSHSIHCIINVRVCIFDALVARHQLKKGSHLRWAARNGEKEADHLLLLWHLGQSVC